jgi:hypothetical protein
MIENWEDICFYRDRVSNVISVLINILTIEAVRDIWMLGWEFVCLFFDECLVDMALACQNNNINSDRQKELT